MTIRNSAGSPPKMTEGRSNFRRTRRQQSHQQQEQDSRWSSTMLDVATTLIVVALTLSCPTSQQCNNNLIAPFQSAVVGVQAYLPPSTTSRTVSTRRTTTSHKLPFMNRAKESGKGTAVVPSKQQSMQPLMVVRSSELDPVQASLPKQQQQQPTAASASSTFTLPRLTDEELHELLLQATELRRLTKLQKEMALRSAPDLKNPKISTLQLSRAAGYGDDLHAYERAVHVGHKARETLVTRNIGLVHYCVNNVIGSRKSSGYYNNNNGPLRSLSREDLVQEGTIGLARAIDRYDMSIGGKFSTYAVYWIRAAVLRCIAENDDVVRVPEHVTGAIRKLTKAAQTLGIDIDSIVATSSAAESATWREAKAAKALAEAAGLSDRQLAEAMRVRRRRKKGGVLSFESWMQKGQDYESELLAASTSSAPGGSSNSRSNNINYDDQLEYLQQTLGRFLRPKELEALSWRYGLIRDDNGNSAAIKSTMASTSKATTTTTKNQTKRDYVAEAEAELFGGSVAEDSTVAAATQLKQAQQQQQPSIPVKGKGGEALSFVEVGKKMSVSAEYTRRLCHAAIEKLRRAADDGTLTLELATFLM